MRYLLGPCRSRCSTKLTAWEVTGCTPSIAAPEDDSGHVRGARRPSGRVVAGLCTFARSHHSGFTRPKAFPSTACALEVFSFVLRAPDRTVAATCRCGDCVGFGTRRGQDVAMDWEEEASVSVSRSRVSSEYTERSHHVIDRGYTIRRRSVETRGASK